MISSPDNPKVRALRRLAEDARYRRREGRFAAEGVRLLADALDHGVRAPFALVDPDAARSGPGAAVAARLEAAGTEVLPASASALRAAADTVTPQGIVAALEIPRLPWPEAPTLLLALDGVQDPGNVGAMLRTAAAAGVDCVLLLGGCADPWGAKAVRGGMGAQWRIATRNGTPEDLAVGALRVCVADAGGETRYDEWDWRAPTVVVIGGEARGATERVRGAADATLRIPMRGTESLNAAAAAAVLLFEAARQRES